MQKATVDIWNSYVEVGIMCAQIISPNIIVLGYERMRELRFNSGVKMWKTSCIIYEIVVRETHDECVQKGSEWHNFNQNFEA